HSIVSIYDDEYNLLYENGKYLAEQGKMIGAAFIAADIPEKSWGKSLTIKLEVTEDKAYSKLHDFMVLRSVDSYKYLILNQQAELMLFITILTTSLIIIFVLAFLLLFERRWSSISRQGMFLLSFLALISSWFLAFNGMFNIFINNKVFCANIEYISLFCTPIMLSLFFFEQTKEGKVKRIQISLAILYGLFALICTILNYSTQNYNYCKMISTFHILLLIGTVLDFIIVMKYDMKNKLSSAVIKYGVLISLLIMFFEIVRYNIHRHTSMYISALSRSFTSIAVVIFILALVLSYVVQLADHYISEYEKRNLEKLAYYDVLTGISNRAGCYKHFESLDASKENALVFIDVNNLKYANDVFGHEMGDKLIVFVAEALKTAFRKNGFCGRLGGDEFVAGTYSNKGQKIYDCMNVFNELLYHANEEKLFPFDVSVSYGISISSKENPISVNQLIKEADEKMYENKKMNKMKRRQ
ncbi:MAG TPA: hypothetical protein DG753_07735, partial [Clostridium sp.]|nr:hypothetical protein [Clostridium sp.]